MKKSTSYPFETTPQAMTMAVVFLISYPHFSCHRADAVGP
jgi:hypothetical protein